MLEKYLILQLAITIDPITVFEAVTSMVTLVGKGAFAYYWINKIKKEA